MALQPTNIRRTEDASVAAALEGRWVTAYSGWQLFDPPPEKEDTESDEDFQSRMSELPPMFAGYGYNPFPSVRGRRPRYPLREGYFACTGLTCIRLDGRGGLVGLTKFIRGGMDSRNKRTGERRLLATFRMTGTYELAPSVIPELDAYEGTIHTQHINKGEIEIFNTYAFMVRSTDELEWIWAGGSHRAKGITYPDPYRPVIAYGTLSRMPYLGAPAVEDPL